MHIALKIIYQGYEARIMRRGSFPVNAKMFKEDPHREAARVAYSWMNDIRKEGHISEIIEVVYDQDKDLTELVNQIEKAPLD